METQPMTATATLQMPDSLARRADQMFPTLTQAQIDRITAHGHARQISPGEVLIEAGQTSFPFFVVLRGRIEAVRPSEDGETQITIHGPGQFTGEVTMLSGRHAMANMRVLEPGEVAE